MLKFYYKQLISWVVFFDIKHRNKSDNAGIPKWANDYRLDRLCKYMFRSAHVKADNLRAWEHLL